MSDSEGNIDVPNTGRKGGGGYQSHNDDGKGWDGGRMYKGENGSRQRDDDYENGWNGGRKSGGGGGYRKHVDEDEWSGGGGGDGRRGYRKFNDDGNNGGRSGGSRYFGNSNQRRGESRNNDNDDNGGRRNSGGGYRNFNDDDDNGVRSGGGRNFGNPRRSQGNGRNHDNDDGDRDHNRGDFTNNRKGRYDENDEENDDSKRGGGFGRGRCHSGVRGGGRNFVEGNRRHDGEDRGGRYENRENGEKDDNNRNKDIDFLSSRGRGGGRNGGRNFLGGDRRRDGDENKTGRYNNRENADDEENGRGRDGGFGRDPGRGGNREFNNGDRRRDNGENSRGRRGRDDEDNGDDKPREVYIPPEPTNDEEEIFHSGITSGINFSKYDNIPVDVSGEDPPPSIQTFDQAGLRDIIFENIRKSGYVTPTPIQKAAIPVILGGRDLMACAQTGSGKTAAFLLPIINKLLSDNNEMVVSRPHALVVTPTRELAQQIFNEARKFALGSYLKICLIYGGTSVKYQTELVAKGSHILIVTPGRLIDFVDRGKISFADIQFVVLDEADRMLDMGFYEAIGKIMQHETMPDTGERQTLMFSATFPKEIQHLAGKYLNNYIFVTIGMVGGACSDVTQTIYETSKTEKRAKLMELIEDSPRGTMVFVETKRNADFIASVLSETEFPTTSIHGDRLQSQREAALRDFKSGRMQIIIATSVAARGLDIKNVQHVINYDLPKSIDEYVHRIGRTGRLGNKGRSSSFFDPNLDSAIASDLVRILKGAEQDVPDFLQNYSYRSGGGTDDYEGENRRDVRGGRTVRNRENETEGPVPLEDDEEWN